MTREWAGLKPVLDLHVKNESSICIYHAYHPIANPAWNPAALPLYTPFLSHPVHISSNWTQGGRSTSLLCPIPCCNPTTNIALKLAHARINEETFLQ